MGAKSLPRFAVVLCCLCTVCPAWGIVLHPDHEPNLATWVDHPPVSVVGRWGNNASCVAIAPNYVITTKHQGISVATTVELAGVTYNIDDYWGHPDVANPADPNFRRVDLRLAKLHAANLDEYVDVDEMNNVSDMVIGGYGDGRGTILINGNMVYGYAWDTSGGNTVQRWCTNKIEGYQDDITYSNYNGSIKYNIDALLGLFDDPNDPEATDYEGIPADHDSGGGWFIYSAGKWYVATLTAGVEHLGESHFRDENDPSSLDADVMMGLRLSSYVDWIYDNMDICTEMLEMDLNGDCVVDEGDLADFAIQWLRDDCDAGNNYCQGADVIDAGAVNMSDFAALSLIWLENRQES